MHVQHATGEAKFWLDRLELAENYWLSASRINENELKRDLEYAWEGRPEARIAAL